MDPQQREEVETLLRALDSLAAEWACAFATAAYLQDLQAVADALAADLQRRLGRSKVVALDLSFRDVLYRASRHQRLQEWWRTVRPEVRKALLNCALPDELFHAALARRNQRIADAVKAHDRLMARAAIETFAAC